MPKVEDNLKILESPGYLKDRKSKVDAVFSSVIIAYVFTNYDVSMNIEHYETLLACLKLPPDGEICAELMTKINKFDGNTSRYIKLHCIFHV